MGRPSKYPAEFREQAVELVKVSTGKTVAEVARDLGINDTTLGNWGTPPPGLRRTPPTWLGLSSRLDAAG